MSRANGWEPYKDEEGKWNWRVWSSGQVIGGHQQGYENWDDMVDAVLSVAGWITAADRVGELDEAPQ
jgi:uncharacterized protein YegP (UPF0339 family)